MTSSTSLMRLGVKGAVVSSSKSMALGCMAAGGRWRCCWPPEACAGTLSACSATPAAQQVMALAGLVLGHAQRVIRSQRDVLQHGHMCEQVELLKHHAPSSARMRADPCLPAAEALATSVSPESMVFQTVDGSARLVDLPEPEGPIAANDLAAVDRRLISLRRARSYSAYRPMLELNG